MILCLLAAATTGFATPALTMPLLSFPIAHEQLGRVSMGVPPSPPPAVDNRFPGRENQAETAKGKYGLDPRIAMEDAIGDASWASAIVSGEINALQTIEQLLGVLDLTASSDQLVVLKFRRDGCAACASTNFQVSASLQHLPSPICYCSLIAPNGGRSPSSCSVCSSCRKICVKRAIL